MNFEVSESFGQKRYKFQKADGTYVEARVTRASIPACRSIRIKGGSLERVWFAPILAQKIAMTCFRGEPYHSYRDFETGELIYSKAS